MTKIYIIMAIMFLGMIVYGLALGGWGKNNDDGPFG